MVVDVELAEELEKELADMRKKLHRTTQLFGNLTLEYKNQGESLWKHAERLEEVEMAAQDVVDRWETPLWKDAEPTAAVIYRLRDILANNQDQQPRPATAGGKGMTTTSDAIPPLAGPSGSECFCGGKGWVMLVGMGVANRRIPCPDCNVDGWPICCDCGKRMRYNVPRLGPSGGYVHADTGRFSCDHQEERPA